VLATQTNVVNETFLKGTVRPEGWEKFTLKVHLERCNLQ